MKANGLEAATLEIFVIPGWPGDDECYWYLRVKGAIEFRSARSYMTPRGARLAVNRFCANLGISMKSVEVVE